MSIIGQRMEHMICIVGGGRRGESRSVYVFICEHCFYFFVYLSYFGSTFFVFMSSVQEILRFDSNTSDNSFMSGKSNTIFPVAGTH